jgi:hypothetical protein
MQIKLISMPNVPHQQASRPKHMLNQPRVRLANAICQHEPHRSLPDRPNNMLKTQATRHETRATALKHLHWRVAGRKKRLNKPRNLSIRHKHPPSQPLRPQTKHWNTPTKQMLTPIKQTPLPKKHKTLR